MTDEHHALLQRFAHGERAALAKVLSLVEAGALSDGPRSVPAETRVVGVTGSGGSGKSTLVAALIDLLRGENLRVAVLASDPQSPVSGGALLGDRIRVRFEPDDEGVYFRSLSTRGAEGGISAATGPAIAWLKAFGFDVVFVETVGVGQDQVAVRRVVDRLVLVLTPNTGDVIQWEKAGVIEVADVIAINKSDLAGADSLQRDLQSALSLLPGSRPVPIHRVVATKGLGVAELWQAIVAADHR